MQHTLAWVAITCLLVASQPSLAHSGGTDSQGCHVESATGIRHCHTPKGGSTSDNTSSSTSDRTKSDSDDTWETVGVVVGGLLVLGLVCRWMQDDKATSSFDAADSGPSDLGIRVNADESGAQSIGVYWRYGF